MIKFFINITILLCGLILSVVVSEIGLRKYFLGSIFTPIYPAQSSLREPDQTLGWKLLPNGVAWYQTFDSSVLVKINSRGHRSPEVEIERSHGVPRVVLLGDSFIEGYSVPFEKSIAGLLPSKTDVSNLEVVNLGVGGYSSFQQYLSLKEEGVNFHPDVVIHFIYPSNDLYENVPKLNSLVYAGDPIKIFGRPFLEIQEDSVKIHTPDYEKSKKWVEEQRIVQRKNIEQSSFLSRMMLWKLLQRVEGVITPHKLDAFDPNIILGWGHLEEFSSMDAMPDSGLDKNSYNELWAEGWNILRHSVVESKKLCDSIGAKYLLVNIPAKLQIESDIVEQLKAKFPNTKFDLDKINRELAAFAKAEDIEFIDLLEPLRKGSVSAPVYYGWEDRHLNIFGQQIATEEVSSSLRQLLKGKHD